MPMRMPKLADPAGEEQDADRKLISWAANQEGEVTDPFYVSSADVWKVEGVHRRARLQTGTEFDMGVHGPIKEHYRLEAEDQPLPVDYLVALTGG